MFVYHEQGRYKLFVGPAAKQLCGAEGKNTSRPFRFPLFIRLLNIYIKNTYKCDLVILPYIKQRKYWNKMILH